MSVEVITYQDWGRLGIAPSDVVVTVSRAEGWSRGLSPFFLGPCELWGGHVARNVENAWQFSKAYLEHTKDGKPTAEWFRWAEAGWDATRAYRYPMGKGRKPEFSYWHGKCISYVQARKWIYIPVYHDAVEKTEAWKDLYLMHDQFLKGGKTLYLVDFDAYQHKKLGMSYKDVVEDPNRKMGHAFVLSMMLEEPERMEVAVAQAKKERSEP